MSLQAYYLFDFLRKDAPDLTNRDWFTLPFLPSSTKKNISPGKSQFAPVSEGTLGRWDLFLIKLVHLRGGKLTHMGEWIR